jgi:glycosyltransferase involved in cell wall biosynthesis
LQKQSFKNFEVLICVTNPERSDNQLVKTLAPELNIRIVGTTKRNIASARNQGLKRAKGYIVFFLDEDCYLPRRTYLYEMTQFHQGNPILASGGFYLSPTNSAKSDQFYNFVCNVWAKSRHSLKSDSPVLLGGCCFYPRQLLQKNSVLFDERNSHAGEEYLLNASWTKLGLPITLSHRWSVFHQPETSFYQVFQKSWTQGSQLQPQKVIFHLAQIKSGLRFLYEDKEARLVYLPMLGLYCAIGRASFLTKLAKKFYSHNKPPWRKKHGLPPFLEKPVNTELQMFDLTSKKNRILSKKKEIPKINMLKSNPLIKKSVKTRAEQLIYKN